MKTAAALWREQWAYCAHQFTRATITATVLRRTNQPDEAEYLQRVARRMRMEALYAQECHWACVVNDPGANDPTF